MTAAPLSVLVVDDEEPSLNDLMFELRSSEGILDVVGVRDATEALRAGRSREFDVIFLDVRMPGLDGLELARVFGAFRSPPPIVFVTAYEEYAVDAFEVNAVDYLLKPVRRERLDEALRRVRAYLAKSVSDVAQQPGRSTDTSDQLETSTVVPQAIAATPAITHRSEDERISVESGGRIRVIARKDVQYVAASGDYVRLFLAGSSVLYRSTISALDEKWSSHGFVRIHRGYLVNLRFVEEVRVETGRGYLVQVGGRGLPVSRRLARNLKQRLLDDGVEE